MSIASRITEMETHINNAYTSIDNLGIDISNTNKNIYNISTLLDTFYESLPKVSGIGSNLSLSPSMVGKIKLNEIQGNTLQDGTPTPDTPIPIESVTGLQNVNVCGKNLLDLSKCINGYINASGEIGTGNDNLLSDYIKVESGTSYTISLNTQFQNIGYALFDSNKTYISRQNNNNKTTLTIIIPSGTSYIRVWFTLTGGTALTPTNILQYEPMIEQSSIATSYEPYTGNTYEVNLGNIELNTIGDYEDSIKKSTGKNLFDKDNMTLSLYFDTTSMTLKSNNQTYIAYAKVPKNTDISISKTSATNRFRIGFCSTIPELGTTFVKSSVWQDDTQTLSATVNSGEYEYVLIQYTNTGQDTNIQIEQNSQATSYEPYGKVWYVEKNNQKLILNSTDYTWNRNTTPVHGVTRSQYYTNITDKQFKTNDVLCDYFYKSTESDVNTFYYGTGGKNLVFVAPYVNESYITTLEEWKTWIDSVKMSVIGILPTPKYTAITNTELIEQLETLSKAKSEDGTTNIVITSNDLPMLMDVSVIKGDA